MPQPLYMEICAEGDEVAGGRICEQIIFMNDTTEVGEKMLRLCEWLQINVPVESSVDGPYQVFLSASYSLLEFLFDAVINHSVRQSSKAAQCHGQAPLKVFTLRVFCM